jgi:SAM-dependent methyltransferase
MSKSHFLARMSRTMQRIGAYFLQRLRIPVEFSTLQGRSVPRFSLRWQDRWLCLGDATSVTGFDRHYVFHTAWACRILAESQPAEHVDISSSLYFVATVSAFLSIRFYDYRPAQLALSGLTCDHADLTRLHFSNGSIASLSCMHVVEHIGLARYGDPLDYDGDLKAVAELRRVLAVGGQLLFVVPIGGDARIQFNAHRIYTYRQVLGMFEGFELLEFALIPDDGSNLGLVRHAEEALSDAQRYGCGCFWLRKVNL